MKIRTWIKYEASSVPPGKRKPVYTEQEEYVDAELKEAPHSDLELAFEDNSYDGKGPIYLYEGVLWCKTKMQNDIILENIRKRGYKIETPLDYLKHCNEYCSAYFRFNWDRERRGEDTSREGVIALMEANMEKYLLVDGELYEKTPEPRYVVMTFGLGHNHGGTSLSVTYRYNSNISYKNYYSALDADAAIAASTRTAISRGDTHSIGTFNADIVVHRPDLVAVDPQEDYGGIGDPVINAMNEIMTAADDPMAAALLVTAFAAGR